MGTSSSISPEGIHFGFLDVEPPPNPLLQHWFVILLLAVPHVVHAESWKMAAPQRIPRKARVCHLKGWGKVTPSGSRHYLHDP